MNTRPLWIVIALVIIAMGLLPAGCTKETNATAP